MAEVYVGHFSHRQGWNDHRVFATEKLADRWVINLAKYYWKDYGPEEPWPDDDEEGGEKFWEYQDESGDGLHVEIVCCILETELNDAAWLSHDEPAS
jgi:hypothetical protein